jgi:hypothetical protein
LPDLWRQLPEYLEHPLYSCYDATVLEAVARALEAVARALEAVARALEAVARVQNPLVKVEYSSY